MSQNDNLPQAPPPTGSLDPRLKEVLRKPFVEFVRLDGPTQATMVARYFLSSMGATADDFKKIIGIDLLDYRGHYMECGAALGPTGPLWPGPIRPVLRFKMSQRGRWISQRLEVDGVYHESKMHAWVKIDLWEQLVGDSKYFEEVFLKQNRIAKRASTEPEKK